MSRSTRPLWVGVAVAIAYVAVALVMAQGQGHVRPLFDAVGPPPPYEWVKPPPQFASGNVTPKPVSSDITFTNGRSAAAAASTPDGQFLVNFSVGSFTLHPGDVKVVAHITPGDPASLGPLPAGVHADGNAYRIDLTSEPSGAPVTSLAVAGDVIVTAPFAAVTLLVSSDGQSWERLAAQPVGGPTTVGAPFTRPGWYLAVSSGTGGAASAGRSGGGLGTVAVVVGVVVLALLLIGIGWVLPARRRRSSGRSSGARPRRAGGSTRRPPPGRGGGRRR
jgi:hypothetical protein